MKKSLSLVLLVAFTLAQPAPRAEAKCAMSWMGAFLVTPYNTVLPREASLVIVEKSTREEPAMRDVFNTSAVARGDATQWTFSLSRDGGDSIALTPERIGPGLIRLTPERKPEAGTWSVEGLNHKVSVQFSDDATMPAPLGAPEVTSVDYRIGPNRKRRGQSKNVDATLSAAVPEGAVAIMAKWKGSSGSSFTVTAGAHQVVLFDYPGRCGFHPDSLGLPEKGGDEATLCFVDYAGQLSAPSAPREVTVHEEEEP